VLEPVVGTITDWKQVKLLSVQLNRLRQWHLDGFIAIGDAAHAMSPVMGVGINYAIQDAVALAARIVPELRAGSVRRETLAAVQKRRLPPVKKMQRIQAFIHERIAGPAAQGQAVIPRPVRALLRHAQPIVQRFAARLVGYGFRPEHVGRR
jgi:2-polyprenyl-6-methoxyphenol hydroxylase-like FAD-dependent oxidoreductase